MTDEVEYLDVEDLIELATALLGDPPPLRDVGLLAAAAARPLATAFGADVYPDVWTKAAALLDSVVNHHALIDGDKGLGWLATAVFLERNGMPITQASNTGVYEVVVGVAAHHLSVDDIAGRLQRLMPPAMPDR